MKDRNGNDITKGDCILHPKNGQNPLHMTSARVSRIYSCGKVLAIDQDDDAFEVDPDQVEMDQD